MLTESPQLTCAAEGQAVQHNWPAPDQSHCTPSQHFHPMPGAIERLCSSAPSYCKLSFQYTNQQDCASFPASHKDGEDCLDQCIFWLQALLQVNKPRDTAILTILACAAEAVLVQVVHEVLRQHLQLEQKRRLTANPAGSLTALWCQPSSTVSYQLEHSPRSCVLSIAQ